MSLDDNFGRFESYFSMSPFGFENIKNSSDFTKNSRPDIFFKNLSR